MDKAAIRNKMLTLSEMELEHTQQHYLEHLRAARLDRSEPIESDEQAQAEIASDLAEAFDQPLHASQAKINKLKELDFGPKSEVEEGAVVRIADRYFVIAVATKPFECEGVSLVGISTQAPIFSVLEGKTVGEACSFNGRALRVDGIW